MVGWLCWGLTSQSTIFQSYRDGAIASWVINQYFRGVKCLAQGHNTAAVGLEPRTSRSGVRHSTTEPPRSPTYNGENYVITFSRLFLIGSFSYLQVMRTCIKAWMSLNLGQIPPLTMELAALERLKNRRHHFFFVAIDPILFKLTGNEDMHNILDEFEFRPDRTTNYRVSCPWASEKIPIDL